MKTKKIKRIIKELMVMYHKVNDEKLRYNSKEPSFTATGLDMYIVLEFLSKIYKWDITNAKEVLLSPSTSPSIGITWVSNNSTMLIHDSGPEVCKWAVDDTLESFISDSQYKKDQKKGKENLKKLMEEEVNESNNSTGYSPGN